MLGCWEYGPQVHERQRPYTCDVCHANLYVFLLAPFFLCPSDPTSPFFFSLNGAVRWVGGRYLECTAVCCRLYPVVAPCRSTRYRSLLRVTRRSFHSPGCVDAYLFLFSFSFSALRLDPVTLLFGRHTTPSAVPPDPLRPAGNATPHPSGQRFTLLEHTRTVHEKWREFCCPICNMGFSRRHKVVQVRFVGTPPASIFLVVVFLRPVRPALTLGTSRVQNGVVFVLNFGAGACWAEGAPGACFDERGAPGPGEAHHPEGVIVELTALIIPVCQAAVCLMVSLTPLLCWLPAPVLAARPPLATPFLSVCVYFAAAHTSSSQERAPLCMPVVRNAICGQGQPRQTLHRHPREGEGGGQGHAPAARPKTSVSGASGGGGATTTKPDRPAPTRPA